MGITRIPLVEALSRQAMPVVLNEIMVRTAYFTVRLARELATHEAVAEIDWDGVVPFGDRTIDRMIAAANSKNKNADQLVEDATARLNARREASGRAAGMMSSASSAANILSSMPFLLCLFMRT